jgi:hypothetical protein
MKKLLLLISVAVLLGGCVVYPGYYGYDDSYYYGFPYGYAGPNINLYYSGHYRSGHYGWPGYYYGGSGYRYGGGGYHHGGHGGWHR